MKVLELASRYHAHVDVPLHGRFRLVIAFRLLNKGLRLEVVSRLLGHSSTVVTERAYAELLGSTIREELLAVLGGHAGARDAQAAGGSPPRLEP